MVASSGFLASLPAGSASASCGSRPRAKRWTYPAFAESLAFWKFVPRDWFGAAAAAVVAGELALAVAWLSGRWRHAAEVLAIGILASFLMLTFAKMAEPAPSGCGCFGVIDRYLLGVRTLEQSAWRTGLMLVAAIAALLLRRAGLSTPASR